MNLVIVIYVLLQYPGRAITSNYDRPNSLNDISCHRIKCYEKCKESLPDIDGNFQPPKKSIYFIETSCTGGLRSRFSCSIEAAANNNPNWYIFVIFAGPLKAEYLRSQSYSTLISMQNVYFYRLNTTDFAEGTPVEDIFTNNIISKSLFPVGHTADFLKLLLLYKFGGLYLDLDTIVMKSLDSLPENFIAKQGEDEIASGIMAATKGGVGRLFTEKSVNELSENFTLRAWGGNSNDIYTRTLANICKTSDISQMNEKICQGFHILDHKLFYPIHWKDWMVYYEPGAQFAIDSEAYTHHVWNGYGAKVKLQPNTVFERLARKCCAKIYDLYGDKFGQ